MNEGYNKHLVGKKSRSGWMLRVYRGYRESRYECRKDDQKRAKYEEVGLRVSPTKVG